MDKEIDLSSMSELELKGLIFDESEKIQSINYNIQFIKAELKKRSLEKLE